MFNYAFKQILAPTDQTHVFKSVGPGVVRGDKMTSSDSISPSPSLTPLLTQVIPVCMCQSLAGLRREQGER